MARRGHHIRCFADGGLVSPARLAIIAIDIG